MNILIFHWRDTKHEWAGGSEIYVREISERWVKAGHTVTVFCGQNLSGTLPGEEIARGVRIIRKGGRFGVYFWAAVEYLKRLRYTTDVIIDAQNGIPFFSCLYSTKPVIGLVHHIHGRQFFIELPFPFSVVGYVIERYLFPLCYRTNRIIAVSHTTKDELVRIGFDTGRIRVVHNGVANGGSDHEHEKFRTPTLLYLGRIKKYKRVDLLIRLMPEIVRKVPDVRLLIAGWGTEASSVIDSFMRGTLRKKIRVLGPVSDQEKRSLLQKSWVFVNPSINEGWGISVIEANRYGTPAVAFRVGGLSESIQDKKTGLLADTEEEFTGHVIRLLTDRTIRERLGRQAAEWSRRFSWDTAARESLSVVEAATKTDRVS